MSTLTSCLPCEKSVSGTCAERLKSTTERRFLCLELLNELLPLVLGCEVLLPLVLGCEVWRLESSTSLDSSGLMVERGGVGESGASLIIIKLIYIILFYISTFLNSTLLPSNQTLKYEGQNWPG